MLLVGACPGQEMRNQEWLLAQNAAVAAEASSAGRVAAALRDQDRLTALAANARALSAPRAADQVVDVALRVAEVGSWRAAMAA
jgi:UDP-N-acetylglucosamine:LPS N-acetylglucosamine transferase